MLRACLFGAPVRTVCRMPASHLIRAFASKAAKSPKASSKRAPNSDESPEAEQPMPAVAAPAARPGAGPVTASIAPTMSAGKRQALETAFKQIEMSYGKGSVMKLGARHTQQMALNIPVIPTGSIALDAALGIGGVPKGRVVEVYGPESSGKTTLALHIIAEGINCWSVALILILRLDLSLLHQCQ
jgi:hypothetical protein